LKSPGDSINPQALSFKYPLVPFFPYKVDTDAQGNSSYSSFKIAFPRPQTTKSTIQIVMFLPIRSYDLIFPH
jgi:hypothetical protein